MPARNSALPVAAVEAIDDVEGISAGYSSAVVALCMEDDQPLSCVYSPETSDYELDPSH